MFALRFHLNCCNSKRVRRRSKIASPLGAFTPLWTSGKGWVKYQSELFRFSLGPNSRCSFVLAAAAQRARTLGYRNNMGARRHGQGCPLWKCCKVFCALVVIAKQSVDELFMHYFHNLSSASVLGAIPGPRPATFVPRPLICSPLEKKSCGRSWLIKKDKNSTATKHEGLTLGDLREW